MKSKKVGVSIIIALIEEDTVFLPKEINYIFLVPRSLFDTTSIRLPIDVCQVMGSC
jgi:hypothetical protein